MCFLLHLNPLIPLPFSSHIKRSKKERRVEREKERTKKMDSNYDQNGGEAVAQTKTAEISENSTRPFLENSILLFGCGQSKISVCQHHMENYSISQTPEEMRKDKGTNRLACLSVMRENYSFCTGFLLSILLICNTATHSQLIAMR